MIEDKTSARWIAIGGLFVAASACVACLMVTIALTSIYGGQTVRFRNPFAAPTAVVVNSTTGGSNATTGSSSTTGSGSTTTTGSSTTGSTTTGSVSSTTGSTGSLPTTGNATDYLPTLSGYSNANTGTIQGAFDLLMQSGALSAQSSSGNGSTFSAQSLSLSAIATSILVSRLDDFIACYRQTGAVDARVYIQSDITTLLNGNVPPMGAVVVVNQDRAGAALLDCAVSASGASGFSAQSANQPCGNSGNFTQNGTRFTYLYAGTSTSFCSAISSYYSQFGS